MVVPPKSSTRPSSEILNRFPERFHVSAHPKVEAEEWGTPEAFKVTNCEP